MYLGIGNFNSEDLGIYRWCPPSKGYWKLNCDGTVRNNGKDAACGGLLRNSHGSFGFSQRLEVDLVLESELWGIYHGLRLAWGRGYKKLLVETDSQEVLDLLTGNAFNNHTFHCLIQGILDIGAGNTEILRRNINRDFNEAANKLTTRVMA